MAQFPRTEAEIFDLAQAMAAGLAANAATYPAPPVTSIDLGSLINGYVVTSNAAIAAQAASAQAFDDKNAALEAMVDGMKSDLRYAENTVDYDDTLLKLIGWGGRATATTLQTPGQSRLLEAPKPGPGQGKDYSSLTALRCLCKVGCHRESARAGTGAAA